MEMTDEMLQSSLEDVLSGQLIAAEVLRDSQRRLLQSVKARDWAAFLTDTAVIEELSEEFATLEKQRAKLVNIAAAKSGCGKSFYAVTASFPREKKERLNSLFRELKRVLVLAKTETMVFARYVAEEKAALSSILEHIVPQSKARTYTKRGALSSGLEEGMMLDAVF